MAGDSIRYAALCHLVCLLRVSLNASQSLVSAVKSTSEQGTNLAVQRFHYTTTCSWCIVLSFLALKINVLLIHIPLYCSEILNVRRLVIDWFSFAFIIWNFGVTGLMVIHWKGPLRLQQAYLITVSALVVSIEHKICR